MRTKIRASFGLILIGLGPILLANESILIAQVRADSKESLPVANFLATELEAQGRYRTVIVWSQTDPLIRAAVNEKLFRAPTATPNVEELTEAANKLRLTHVAIVTAIRSPQGVEHRIELFRAGKKVWEDPDFERSPDRVKAEQMRRRNQIDEKQYQDLLKQLRFRIVSVSTIDKLNEEATAQTIARNWTQYMADGPARHQVERPLQPTPEPSPGQQLPKTDVNIVPKARVVDNADLRSQIAAMNRSNMSSIGINMLRDAVDQEPLDYERRTLLITFLLQAGNAEMAAKEARRAAELMPAKIELRAMAARAWLQAGNAEEAQGDLNEAIARDPEGLETRVLLAEVSLGSGDGKGAIAHLDFALQKGESAELRFKRALANAVVGNLKEADADLLKASPGLATDALAVSTRYRISIHTLSAAIRRHSNDLSALIQRALVQRSNAEVKAEYDRLQIAVLAASSYLDKVGVPERHKNSHERRVLALNLLTQTLSDLGSFLDTGNEDVLTDARINFGEALKQSASAVEGYEAESREPTIDSGTDRL